MDCFDLCYDDDDVRCGIDGHDDRGKMSTVISRILSDNSSS